MRLACSPDTSMYMVVREPIACSYIVVVYTPTVCDSPELTPDWLIKVSIPQQVLSTVLCHKRVTVRCEFSVK